MDAGRFIPDFFGNEFLGGGRIRFLRLCGRRRSHLCSYNSRHSFGSGRSRFGYCGGRIGGFSGRPCRGDLGLGRSLGAVPCGIAASPIASATSFPEFDSGAEAALGSVAQTPGGVATGAFGGMGIVEPLSGPDSWIPVAGGLVLNLAS